VFPLLKFTLLDFALLVFRRALVMSVKSRQSSMTIGSEISSSERSAIHAARRGRYLAPYDIASIVIAAKPGATMGDQVDSPTLKRP